MGTPVTASQPDVVTTATMADDDAKRKEELNNQLKEYISEWRKTREKEEDELSKLKEKQAKRKEIRLEQEKKLNQAKREEEEKMKKEEAERKAKEAEEKKKRLEEAEAKRQEMLEAQKAQKAEMADKKKSTAGGEANDARKELFKIIIQLETDKYDYEQRKLTQELDLKELKERQKAQLRAKALKKGLDPEALTGRYPPKIRMYSKYERRTDTRSYDDRKKMYEGGWEVVRAEHLESCWKEKYDEWSKRPSRRLPKWFGERPGKKKGDPETPEGGDEEEAAAAEEEYDEEEEEEEEYDEEEE